MTGGVIARLFDRILKSGRRVQIERVEGEDGKSFWKACVVDPRAWATCTGGGEDLTDDMISFIVEGADRELDILHGHEDCEPHVMSSEEGGD